METRSRVGRAEWQKRIERWKESGLNAEQFAAELGINAGTLHHVVPDEVVRDEPLFQEARKRGQPPYDVDNVNNGAYLAEDVTAQTAARDQGLPSADLPLHRGSHPEYSLRMRGLTQRVENALIKKYGSLDNVPAAELTRACEKVELLGRELLARWTASEGARLK